jgi:cold shock CspA family protein
MTFDHTLAEFLRAQSPAPARESTETIKMGISLGSVAFFDEERGFGFIRPDAVPDGMQRDDDVFVAARALKGTRSIKQHDRVSFDVVESKKKQGRFEAKNVRLA